MRRTTVVCCAALALTLAGCGGGTSTSRPRPAPTATSSAPPTARSAVAAGIAALAHAGSVRFTTSATLEDLSITDESETSSVSYTAHGVFATSPSRASFSRDYAAGTSHTHTETRLIGDRFYGRVPFKGVPQSDCWITGDRKGAGVPGFPEEFVSPELPAEAYLAASATGASFLPMLPGTAPSVSGTVDFADLLALAGPQVPEKSGVVGHTTRVEATLTLTDGVLTGIQVTSDALDLAAYRANPKAGDAQFPTFSLFSVTFDALDKALRVDAPAPADTVDLSAGAPTAGAHCGPSTTA